MTELAEILAQTLSFARTPVAFGDVTVAQARERADELRAAVGFGPTARVAPVAQAWRELMLTMQRGGVDRVRELPPEVVLELAPKLWIVPPGGSLL
jgi:hypothetical protein